MSEREITPEEDVALTQEVISLREQLAECFKDGQLIVGNEEKAQRILARMNQIPREVRIKAVPPS